MSALGEVLSESPLKSSEIPSVLVDQESTPEPLVVSTWPDEPSALGNV